MSSKKLPPQPPVPDLARVRGNTPQEISGWLIEYYNKRPVNWNYRCGTRIIKQAYKGFHNLPQLIAGCSAERTKQGRSSNTEIVQLAAPLAFGRAIQVFDLPRRQFEYGRNFRSSYRIPFFFTENGTVKLFFLQPRKGDEASLTYDQLGMIAAIHKRYLLDVEFLGLPCDIEYVDLACNPDEKARSVNRFSLSDIPMWSEERLENRLSMIVEGLQLAYDSDKIAERVRPQKPEEDMPLF